MSLQRLLIYKILSENLNISINDIKGIYLGINNSFVVIVDKIVETIEYNTKDININIYSENTFLNGMCLKDKKPILAYSYNN